MSTLFKVCTCEHLESLKDSKYSALLVFNPSPWGIINSTLPRFCKYMSSYPDHGIWLPSKN